MKFCIYFFAIIKIKIIFFTSMERERERERVKIRKDSSYYRINNNPTCLSLNTRGQLVQKFSEKACKTHSEFQLKERMYGRRCGEVSALNLCKHYHRQTLVSFRTSQRKPSTIMWQWPELKRGSCRATKVTCTLIFDSLYNSNQPRLL